MVDVGHGAIFDHASNSFLSRAHHCKTWRCRSGGKDQKRNSTSLVSFLSPKAGGGRAGEGGYDMFALHFPKALFPGGLEQSNLEAPKNRGRGPGSLSRT